METILPAYLTDGENVSHSFMVSMLGMTGHASTDAHARVLEPIRRRTGPADIATGRNELTLAFLDTEADWLWFVDTDMGFAPSTPLQLRQSADPAERPVVGALCFTWRCDVPDGMGGYAGRLTPTLFGWDDQGFRVAVGYPRGEIVRTAATGAACLLIHRSALEKVRAEFGDEWWSQVRYPSGQTIGEDLSFCWRLGKVGVPVHVDTSIKTTHAKTVWLGERDFDA